jgi:signal transduction histidine kinase
MQQLSTKHIFNWFVLPVIIFIIAAALSTIFLNTSLPGYAWALGGITGWITALLIARKRHFLSGSAAPGIPTESPEKQITELQTRLAALEEELRKERLEKVRSLIDGQDKERQRLSRELHDGLGQSLIAVKLALENAEGRPDSQVRATVDVAKGMVDETIDEVRRVSNALLPAALHEFGIIPALRARCEEMASVARMQVLFRSEGSLDRLEKKSKIYLYRIAQEAITNAIRHSRAAKVEVSLTRAGDEVSLLVKDDGKGFDPDPLSIAGRNGIANMRERVELLHGRFELDTRLNAGTQIHITVPYHTIHGKDSDHPG